MKHLCLILATTMFLAVTTQAAPKGAPLNIPGTGIKIMPPPGMALGHAGAMLLEQKGERIILFAISEKDCGIDDDQIWRGIFPAEPEHLTGALEGKLYQRTRAANGGGWDGYRLCVMRGKKGLMVMAMYTGASPEEYKSLRDYLLTITWDSSFADDPEMAMGLGITTNDLSLREELVGALAYTKTWIPPNGETLLTPKDTDFMVQALPASAIQVARIFPAGCKQAIAAVVKDPSFKEPTMGEQKGFSYCEGWGGSDYAALVRLDSGALLSIIASASPLKFEESVQIFRDALKTIHPVGNR